MIEKEIINEIVDKIYQDLKISYNDYPNNFDLSMYMDWCIEGRIIDTSVRCGIELKKDDIKETLLRKYGKQLKSLQKA